MFLAHLSWKEHIKSLISFFSRGIDKRKVKTRSA